MLRQLLSLFVLLAFNDNGTAKAGEDKVDYIRSKWRFYLEENGGRMVLTTEREGMVRDCYVFGDRNLINVALKSTPYVGVIKLDKRTMNALTDYCNYAKWSNTLSGTSGEEIFVEFGIFSCLLIYPGTKWCGAGNISKSYDDLGPEREADICCRDHDHCNVSIEGFGSKCGVDNNSPFTKSHCDCDGAFHQCLTEANTRASNRIGKLFFNFIQMECIRKDHPIIGCNRYKGFFRPRCQEYILDKEQEPFWQMFDAKHFEPKSDEENEVEDRYNEDVFDFLIRFQKHNLTEHLKNK